MSILWQSQQKQFVLMLYSILQQKKLINFIQQYARLSHVQYLPHFLQKQITLQVKDITSSRTGNLLKRYLQDRHSVDTLVLLEKDLELLHYQKNKAFLFQHFQIQTSISQIQTNANRLSKMRSLVSFLLVEQMDYSRGTQIHWFLLVKDQAQPKPLAQINQLELQMTLLVYVLNQMHTVRG